MRGNLLLFVLLFSIPTLSWGQSLGDAARKERERREKNKSEGVDAREFSEKEIFGEEEEEEEGAAEDGDEEEAPDGAEQGRSARPSIDMGSAPPEADANGAPPDPRGSETEWRSRFQEAKQRIEDAREYVQFLENLNLMPGESYIDARGNTVIQSLEHLRRLVTEAEAELVDAERALPELQEEARRAGVPPGWRR